MKKLLRRLALCCLLLFLLMNVIAFLHAWRFTHFSDTASERTKDPKELSIIGKLAILLTGIENPQPKHKSYPEQSYDTVFIESTVRLEGWYLRASQPVGTIIMFHGYTGEKSSLLSRAGVFMGVGYNILLVDFMGSGGSAGNSTSVGYEEAKQVKDCYDFIRQKGENNLYLFGTSMGAVAILKAAQDSHLELTGAILECPFGSLYQTVGARFKMMNVPAFPMAGLLTFWGGVQHGYWAFGHNPEGYAQAVTFPTLLLYGEQDDRVSMKETQSIYKNMKGDKALKTYPHAGHNVFSENNQQQWIDDVENFMQSTHHP